MYTAFILRVDEESPPPVLLLPSFFFNRTHLLSGQKPLIRMHRSVATGLYVATYFLPNRNQSAATLL